LFCILINYSDFKSVKIFKWQSLRTKKRKQASFAYEIIYLKPTIKLANNLDSASDKDFKFARKIIYGQLGTETKASKVVHDDIAFIQ